MNESQKMDLILQELGGIKNDVSAVAIGLQAVKEDVQAVKEDVQAVKEDVQAVKEDVQAVKEDVQAVKEEVQVVKKDLAAVKEDVQQLKDRVLAVEITLENETNRNIKLIAEGHLNLDRKLDEALKELQPNTLYHLQVNHLSSEVTKVKRVLNMA